MRLSHRSIHRDLGYFYVGLIIAFAFSGIFLNHRQAWYPTNYVFESEPVSVTLPADREAINQGFIDSLSRTWGLEGQLKGFRIRDKTLRITYKEVIYELDVKTGQGERERYFRVPVLAQSTNLHVETNGLWIWYSDIFGVALLTIAITGMYIQRGKTSFRARGWKLALAGLLFPLLFLFVLS